MATTDNQSFRVLIVDDSLIIRKSLSLQLEHLGHRAETCESGEQALDLLKDESFDFMILDLHMEGFTGYDVLEKLQERGSELPVFVLTADMQKASREKVFELGAKGYFNKPQNPNEIMQVINQVLNV